MEYEFLKIVVMVKKSPKICQLRTSNQFICLDIYANRECVLINLLWLHLFSCFKGC